jgi:hypothetical protein
MTDERYKAIMAELGQPHSHSLLAALRQVANEAAQEMQAAERERCADGIAQLCIEVQRYRDQARRSVNDVGFGV